MSSLSRLTSSRNNSSSYNSSYTPHSVSPDQAMQIFASSQQHGHISYSTTTSQAQVPRSGSNQNYSAQQLRHEDAFSNCHYYHPVPSHPQADSSDYTYSHATYMHRSPSQDYAANYPHDAVSACTSYNLNDPPQSPFPPPSPYPNPQTPYTAAYGLMPGTLPDPRREGGYASAQHLESSLISYTPNPANVALNNPYQTPAFVIPDDASQLPTSPGQCPKVEYICEWDDCGMVLDGSCPGVRQHLKQHHFQGVTPASGEQIVCRWGGRCRREPMKWENVPKHVAECHTKSMMKVCDGCYVSFSRGDALKRHRESGNCHREPHMG
ncbi:hypothetical protein BC628DRAFT_1338786 [Trametes gibbosa]|uniref:Zinc finger protein 218 n=1 Tax=Trametes gibbosa TaxID=160864 RepID=A0A6B9KJS7_9APHY|nr:hypothetical protein BC628DRAFT_1338786 [Trametes gibbosa]QHA24591.1 zinc finger protein 218 [Trametes gibbosa]